MTRLILDCDPGIDDALALLLACASPSLDLLSVTTVSGNRPVATTTENTCRLLQLAGRPDVPVHAGAARPLARAEPRCNLVHGEDGLGGVALPSGSAPSQERACDAIARTLLREPAGSITLVAVGPLTNLALAEILHPGVLRRAAKVVVMGGAVFRRGNVTPAAEFNFYADPLAAHTVLESAGQVHLFGLDVTSQAAMPPEWIASLGDLPTRSAQAAQRMLHAYALKDPLLHDACPVAWLLEPGLFEGQPCHVQVDWQPGATEGQSRPAQGAANGTGNAVAYTGVDAAGLLARVHAGLGMLP